MMKKIFLFTFITFGVMAQTEVITPSGKLIPIFSDRGEEKIEVASLKVDKTPVTNKEFLLFVKENPEWQKEKISSLFAEETYLSHWSGNTTFPKGLEKKPVVYVSWFAARAYCDSQGKRLPNLFEWEYFSDSSSEEFEKNALLWYARTNEKTPEVGQKKANKFGLHDTNGLVWEWVEDFQSVIMAGDSRQGGDSVFKEMFCAGAALGAKDPKKYAAFIRYAMRASLKGKSTIKYLGFRCVQDMIQEKK